MSITWEILHVHFMLLEVFFVLLLSGFFFKSFFSKFIYFERERAWRGWGPDAGLELMNPEIMT